MYSIQIKATGKYVKYCDNCWYETSIEPWPFYTKEQAEAVAKKMREHYVYDVIISNGTETYEKHFFNPIEEMKPVENKKKGINVSTYKFNGNK